MGVLPLSSQELAARMDEQRQAIGETVDRLRARLRREWDLPRQLADHSRLACTIAALAGFATGRLLRRLLG